MPTEECGVNGIKYYDEEDGNSILVFNPEIVHILKTQSVDACGKLLIENKQCLQEKDRKEKLNKIMKKYSEGKGGNMNYNESRREQPILRGFKKGYEALVDALKTQLPTSWGFVRNYGFRRGSDDFNGDYIIEMSFDTIDASNIRYYIDGDVKRVKMTTYFNHEKAIANLINEVVDFDDVYVMEGPGGETSLYITNATPANEPLSSRKGFNEGTPKSGRKLKESESNFYYFGICCYEKKDTKHDYPCFLAIGKDGDFVPVGWSFWEILAGSKFVKGESESDPTYGSKTAKMMTLNDLWVECHTSDPSKNPDFDPSNFLMRLEKVFPDFDFYATVYPKSKMDAYYDYKDGPATEDLPADVEAAYMRLNDKLQNVELKEKSSWSFPF